MTVAELIERLQREDPAATVGAWSDCHDCGGTNVTVEASEGCVDISGKPDWMVDPDEEEPER